MFKREQILADSGVESLFLWGARQTGKSTLLKSLFKDAAWFDLLKTDVYRRLLTNPEYLRETIVANTDIKTVVIDEIQRIPELLNEIHWLISNTETRFILSGSSPRKIIRQGNNLLGGRALRYELYPLISREIPGFDLIRALNHGLLPRHYLSNAPQRLISSYIGNYLQDEIAGEAKIRNLGNFSRFLTAAAFSNGEMVNYANIAGDCGVSAPTVKEYFQILEDTLLGRFVPAFQKKPKRRVITAPKFYYFDVGIANFLLKRGKMEQGSEAFGHAFEHFIYNEIYVHSKYSGLDYPVSYWRTASQIEVDFILGDHEVAIEVKSGENIQARHLKGLKQFAEEYPTKHLILVCNESMPRLVDNVWIMPWQHFLQKLHQGQLMG
jgi:predicted AAA+ superfamily ATPase